MAAKPPTFGDKSYELYKLQLLAWEELTDLADDKKGIYIALSLPDNHDTKIKEKVFESLGLDSLKSTSGLKELIEFLDRHLQKESLDEAWDRFEQFEDFSRLPGQNMNSYISEFDRRYERVKIKGLVLPDNLLAFKLLKYAKLTKEERLLVMTGIDLEKDNIYDDTQKSLRKFKSDLMEPRIQVRSEEAFYTNKRPYRGRGGKFQTYSPRNQKNRNPIGRNGEIMKCNRCGSTKHLYLKCMHKGDDAVLNPNGRDGRTMTCNSCESKYHLIADCPHRYDEINIVDIEKAEKDNQMPVSDIIMFTGSSDIFVSELQRESMQMGVLDSACTSTVAGEKWFNDYIESLSTNDREQIVKSPGFRTFRFGGGTILKSKGEYIIPAVVAGNSVKIKTDIVESDIPLLLSLSAMKSMKCNMDYEDDTASLFGKKVHMNITSSGHYCIPLGPMASDEVKVTELNKHNGQDLKNKIEKLHRQFGHPSQDKFKKLLIDAGCWSQDKEELIKNIYLKCSICKEFSHTPPRPSVCLPMAREFNEVVAMDLKSLKENLWILYKIDMFTRYTMATLITRKQPSQVINALLKRWVGIFGIMGKVLTDNGGEFSADEIKDAGSLLNIEVATTGAESPFQNGLCERVHSVTDNILAKLQAQYPKTPLDTLLAWACMAKNSLQMFNGFSSNQLVFGKNPNLPNFLTDKVPALEDSTTSSVLAEHLNALHTARQAFIQSESDERIRRALRTKIRTNEQKFEHGDKVFYKRNGELRWLGPGKVLAQDGKVIFVRHGGSLVRVSANRLLKANDVSFENKETDLLSSEEDSENMIKTKTKVNESIDQTPHVQELDVQEPNDLEPAVQETEQRRSMRIFNRDMGLEGENKVYMVTIPKSQQNNPDCHKAKQTELEKLKNFDVYEEVPNIGQTSISTRWILWKKKDEIRARLVARGFEEVLDGTVDSPTIGKCVMRLAISLAVSKHWMIQSTDIKSAFLQSQPMDREVFIIPPTEAESQPGYIWKLKRCLYGLNDAAKQFYNSVKHELLELGCKNSTLDPSLFYFFHENQLAGILVSHIDDFMHCGNEFFYEKIINGLCKRFQAGSRQHENFKYVGFQIAQTSTGITLSQQDYVENIEVPEIPAPRGIKKLELLTSEEMTKYRSLVGSLNWIVQSTRPDLSFEMTDLSTKFQEGKVEDLLRVMKIMNKAKYETAEIFYPDLGTPLSWKVIVYTDASFGNLGTGSCGGSLVFLSGNNNVALISWKSGKIQRVVKSTLAAEGLALSEGLDEAIYIKHIICETLGFNIENDILPIIGITDHEGLYKNIRSTKLVSEKRLRIDLASIKENLNNGVINDIQLCQSEQQLADVLTKRGVNGVKLLSVLQTGKFLQ